MHEPYTHRALSSALSVPIAFPVGLVARRRRSAPVVTPLTFPHVAVIHSLSP